MPKSKIFSFSNLHSPVASEICTQSIQRALSGAAALLLLVSVAGCSHSVSSPTPTPTPDPTPTPTGSITVAPLKPCVMPSAKQQFTATLTNITGTGVDWSVDTVSGGNSTVGTISTAGLYTAPSAAGQHTIGATSQSDHSASASTAITVSASAQFSVSPNTATVLASSEQSFQSQICGNPGSNVTWTVDGVAGGNSSVGTISADGVYTAPNSAGTHTIKATDSAQNTSEASITVAPGFAIDFGSRSSTQYPIPAGILGVNHVDWWYVNGVPERIAQAGFTLSRTYATIPQVYATRQPDWTVIDPQIAKLKAAGFHVLLQLSFTPAWLQPTPNTCTPDLTKAPPADVNAWAEIAKAYVAHMDQKFPGVVTDYEIWNEPDSGGMCGTSDKLNSYLALYAAAAPLIKQQAAADGATVRVGGPAASSMNTQWFQTLLSNSSTAPYVDFVSYHQYITGNTNLNAAWDVDAGSGSLYSLTKDPAIGGAATYASAAQIVAAGNQPHASTTPIYIDEFNTNWVFQPDCCRNDATYAPVWNALYVGDVLNTVYSGTGQVPGQLTYYAAVSLPYFCLLGDWNADMDCSHNSGAPQPYPQYYAYQLMASADYLGMNAGRYMAPSVTYAGSGDGLQVTAFSTAKQDSILIVNPTSASYSHLISIRNSGLTSPAATLYQVLNGKSIGKNSLTLTSSGTASNATVTIPPYSVLGISLQ